MSHSTYRRSLSVTFFALMLLTGWVVGSKSALAGSGAALDQAPTKFNLAACYQIAYSHGRMIAWARWEENIPSTRVHLGVFGPATPVWIVGLVQDWIYDAYTWQVTDEQVMDWAKELGSTALLPDAEGLSTSETIAIWMRRTAQDCDAREEALAALAPAPVP